VHSPRTARSISRSAATFGASRAVLAAAAAAGVDLQTITDELEHEGVQAFVDSYVELLACIESKVGRVGGGASATR
jgi:hypothetical protein